MHLDRWIAHSAIYDDDDYNIRGSTNYVRIIGRSFKEDWTEDKYSEDLNNEKHAGNIKHKLIDHVGQVEEYILGLILKLTEENQAAEISRKATSRYLKINVLNQCLLPIMTIG